MFYPKGRIRRAKEARIASLRGLADSVFQALGVTRETFAELVWQFDGTIVLPGDPDYDQDRQEADPAFQEYPKIIAYCGSENDVRTCLAWAYRYTWWIACRSGGHSTAGFSVNNGIVIDTSGLSYVIVHPQMRRAIVGAGTNFQTLNTALDSYGMHVPGGICEDVCVAGYMQGGGYGFTSRKWGMNSDNVVSARVMLWDGSIVTADPWTNPDLFWALRGGTGGNFGVLLEITYRIVELGTVWGFGIGWPVELAPDALVMLQTQYMRTGPPDLGYMVAIGRNEMETGQGALMVRGLYLGSAAEGKQVIAPLLATPGARLTIDKSGSYLEIHEYVVDAPPIPVPFPEGAKEVKQGGYIAKPLTRADWQRVIDYHTAAPLPSALTSIEPYGGAINAYPKDYSAFVHRDVDMNFFIDSFWVEDADATTASRWLDGYMAVMKPYFNGEAYQNYPRRGDQDFRSEFWGDAFPTLLAIKEKYDPHNVFHYQQSISPYPPGTGPVRAGARPHFARESPILYDVTPRAMR